MLMSCVAIGEIVMSERALPPGVQPAGVLSADLPDAVTSQAWFDRALAALEGGYDVAPAGTPYTRPPLVIDRIA